MRPRAARVLLGLSVLAQLGAGVAALAEPRLIELTIRNGELSHDARVVRVRQGDDVTLRWTTDSAVTVHLHGYDLEKKLSPGPAVSVRFMANATGRFPIDVHAHGPGRDRTLGYLEVHPR